MKFWKRTLPFLLLNILLSAGATLTVLFLWEQAHPAPLTSGALPAVPASSTPLSSTSLTPVAQPTLPPLDQPVIQIEAVVAPGDLANEVVALQRLGEGELLLTGWRLDNGKGQTYTFPYLVLNKNGSIRIYSRAGSDTVIELYWGAESAVWQSGETVSLYDSAGNLRASFTIP
jgi:hypothetical protein